MPADLTAEIIKEITEAFDKFKEDGFLGVDSLGKLFIELGETLPGFKIREILEEYDANKDGKISLDELIEIFRGIDGSKAYGSKLLTTVKSKTGFVKIGTHEKSAEGTTHFIKDTESQAFVSYINRMLSHDSDVKNLIPIAKNNVDLFNKLSNGIILCKLINMAVDKTIDIRTINIQKLNKFKITENLNLALNSSRAIGIHVINISAEDIIDGKQHLILGLIWQILRMVLFAKLNFKDTPNLTALLREGETLQMLLALSPEELLLRWVNYQMEKFGSNKRVANFSSDLKDGEVYAILVERCLSQKKLSGYNDIMQIKDLNKRADELIRNFEAADLPYLLTSYDIVNGNQKLNQAFLANLFNLSPCLESLEEPMEIIEETREEKMFRNWMNSLGVKPKVNYLYSDLNDGHVLLQMLDMMKPNVVNWKKVNMHPFKPSKESFLKIENCQTVIDISKTLGLSLPGVSANDIATGTQMFTLGLLFQLMRTYTLNLLQDLTEDKKPIQDSQIVNWANEKSGVVIKSFKDPSIHSSEPILKLIEAIQPGSVNFDFMNAAETPEEKLQNANYAISCARKIGARVYALPEDISEGKFKMILTIYACLMVRDLNGN